MISRNKMKRTLNPHYMYMQYVRKFSVNQDTSSCQICLYHRRTDRQRQTSFDCTISGQEANKSDLLVFKTDFPPNHNASEIKFFFSFFFSPQYEEEVAMTRCLNHMPWLEDNRKTIPGVKSIREKCGGALMTQSAKGLSTTMATRDNKSSSSSRMMWGQDGTRTRGEYGGNLSLV